MWTPPRTTSIDAKALANIDSIDWFQHQASIDSEVLAPFFKKPYYTILLGNNSLFTHTLPPLPIKESAINKGLADIIAIETYKDHFSGGTGILYLRNISSSQTIPPLNTDQQLNSAGS